MDKQSYLEKDERNHMVEWLAIWSGYAKVYWEKQSDKAIEINYKQFCIDFAQ